MRMAGDLPCASVLTGQPNERRPFAVKFSPGGRHVDVPRQRRIW
jgi:hypothetical protein